MQSHDRHRRIVIAAFGVTTAIIILSQIPSLIAAGPTMDGHLAADYDLYLAATRRWLSGGPFYEPYQLAGPYQISHGEILYPPILLWLTVPFTFLPAFLWWLLPSAAIAIAIWILRPTFLVWPLMALCLAWPPTQVRLASGNPAIWAAAAMSLGVIVAGPAIFVLVKPTLAPFALWGIRHRRWWLLAAGTAAVGLVFTTMWLDWIRVVRNATDGGLLYSWQEIPLLLLPMVAWYGRRRDFAPLADATGGRAQGASAPAKWSIAKAAKKPIEMAGHVTRNHAA